MALRIIHAFVCLPAALLLASCQTGGFGRADQDRDSLLSFDEFAAAPVGKSSRDAGADFIAADTDRDGALSANEFQFYVSSHAGR